MSKRSIPALLVQVIYPASGLPARADTWGEPESRLYALLNGAEDGEAGPAAYLVDLCAGAPLLPAQWLAVSLTGQMLVRTRHGFRPMEDLSI